jgi:hypothetical protein
MIVTAALGVQVDPMGRIVVLYKNESDDTVMVDLTQVVEKMAKYVFDVRATSVRAVPPQQGMIADNRHVN